MTNESRWQHYTAGLSSPQNYIDWSFRYLIAASLQRRVWVGPDHQSCFPNQYVVLVGNPGIGKGLVIREVSLFLRHWKLRDAIKLGANGETLSDQDKMQVEAVHDKDMENAQESELQCKNKQAGIAEPLLIPIAADATTYEALVEAVATSYRRINYKHTNSDGKVTAKVYGHSSICFSLQELGSLLRKRTDDTVNYMLGLYDCPVDYEYNTKTQGKDRVRRGCLNLLAGTTPGFMQSVFNDKLLDEGFSSRSFFIYAQKNRKNQFFIPALSNEQLEHRKVILDHVRQLTGLYGQVRIDDNTLKFLEQWWDAYSQDYVKRANSSPKMLPYYARKNIHVMKVAMSLHFMESCEMFIPTETYKKAIEILDAEEKNMHLAITIEGSNPLSKVSRRILELLENHRIEGQNLIDIVTALWESADKTQIEEALSFLMETKQVTAKQKKDIIDQEQMYYFLK